MIFSGSTFSNCSLNKTYLGECAIIRKENLKDNRILQQNKEDYRKFLVDCLCGQVTGGVGKNGIIIMEVIYMNKITAIPCPISRNFMIYGAFTVFCQLIFIVLDITEETELKSFVVVDYFTTH